MHTPPRPPVGRRPAMPPPAHWPPAPAPHPRPRSSRWPWVVAGGVLGVLVFVGGAGWAALVLLGDRGATAPASAPAAPEPLGALRVAENLPLRNSTGVAIDPSGSRFLVTGSDDRSYRERQVKVYEIGRDAPAGTLGLPADTTVAGLTQAPDGSRLYVSTSVTPLGGATTAALAVVDPAGPTLIATIPLSGRPGPVAVAPRGDRVYVGVQDGVEVVDLAGRRSLGVTPLGGRADAIAVAPDGRVLAAGWSGLKVLDPTGVAVVATIGLQGGPAGIAVTPDGRYAVVSVSRADAVVYVDLATLAVVGRVEVGKRPTTVVVAPDGRQAVVANTDAGSVSVVDLTGAAPTTELNVGDRPEAIALSRDGRTGFVVTSSNVVRLERAGSQER